MSWNLNFFTVQKKNGVGGAVKEMQSQITVIQRLDKEDPGNFWSEAACFHPEK